MQWMFLEALVALVLAVFIVWWTTRPRRPSPPPAPHDSDKPSP